MLLLTTAFFTVMTLLEGGDMKAAKAKWDAVRVLAPAVLTVAIPPNAQGQLDGLHPIPDDQYGKKHAHGCH